MRTRDGFTLLEVLVGMFLLSFVMLGMLTANTKVLQAGRGIYYFQQAEMFAENMAEYIVNHDGILEPYYSEWSRDINRELPSAHAQIVGNYPEITIKIYWGELQSCTENLAGISGCVVFRINNPETKMV